MILSSTYYFIQISKKSYYYKYKAYAKLKIKTRPALTPIHKNQLSKKIKPF